MASTRTDALSRDRARRAGNTARSINRPRFGKGKGRHAGCTPSVYRSCEIEGKEDRPVQLGCLRATSA
jgi:hypothetical protein